MLRLTRIHNVYQLRLIVSYTSIRYSITLTTKTTIMASTNNSIIPQSVTTLDQLIDSCRSYYCSSINKDRLFTLIEWVLSVATRLIETTDNEIEARFAIARIWGLESELNKIRTQLEAILKPKSNSSPQVTVESSVRIGSCRIDVISTRPEGGDKMTFYPIRGGGYVTITPGVHSDYLPEIGDRLSKLDTVTARNMATIIRDVLNAKSPIFDCVPSNQLIDLGIETVRSVYLWKGTNGLIVSADGHYIGQLRSNGRNIIYRRVVDLDLCYVSRDMRVVYSNLLTTYTSNSENLQRLIKLVRANVSEPDQYPLPVIEKVKYTARVNTLEEDNEMIGTDTLTHIELAYQNWLVITPRVEDDEMVDKIVDYAVDNKNLSIKTLIKNVEEMLNA